MADSSYLKWPFFAMHHERLAQSLDAWATQNISQAHAPDVDAECRQLVKALGEAGWLRHAVAGVVYGGAGEQIDTRAICLIRETLARHSGLADFAFAMQGLGSGAISLAGTEAQKSHYLSRVARGEAIAAFALSEPEAGSDVAAMRPLPAHRRREMSYSCRQWPAKFRSLTHEAFWQRRDHRCCCPREKIGGDAP